LNNFTSLGYAPAMIEKGLRQLTEMAGSTMEWLALKVSCLDHVDGVAVCDLTISQPSKDRFLDLTRQAMALIKSLDPRRYRRVCRCLRYIANTVLLSRGQYGRTLRICRVDFSRHFNSPYSQRNVRDYAGVLIHEATHGLLFDRGVPYNRQTRERVERLCHLEAYRFARRFEPGYADLFPGIYDPGPHRESWERSRKAKLVIWWKRGREIYQEYRLSNPRNSQDFNLRGAAYLQKGDYGKAIEDCDQAIRLDPQLAKAYNNRGLAHLQKRDFERAIIDFNHAIRLDPGDARLRMNCGTAHLGMRSFDKAIALYDEAIQIDPNDARIRMNRGTAYLRTRDYEKAISDYDYAIQIAPQDARVRTNRGTAYQRMASYENAVADYEFAVKLNPRDIFVYRNLAWLLATCPNALYRDGKKAVEYAKKACLLSEWKDSEAVKTLVAAYGEAGDFENAVKWECRYLGTPEEIAKARLNSESRLSLYQAHQTPV
jgi:tetratricopeptide (TPR) repeat protein